MYWGGAVAAASKGLIHNSHVLRRILPAGTGMEGSRADGIGVAAAAAASTTGRLTVIFGVACIGVSTGTVLLIVAPLPPAVPCATVAPVVAVEAATAVEPLLSDDPANALLFSFSTTPPPPTDEAEELLAAVVVVPMAEPMLRYLGVAQPYLRGGGGHGGCRRSTVVRNQREKVGGGGGGAAAAAAEVDDLLLPAEEVLAWLVEVAVVFVAAGVDVDGFFAAPLPPAEVTDGVAAAAAVPEEEDLVVKSVEVIVAALAVVGGGAEAAASPFTTDAALSSVAVEVAREVVVVGAAVAGGAAICNNDTSVLVDLSAVLVPVDTGAALLAAATDECVVPVEAKEWEEEEESVDAV
uniref:Uncharacterized protein n=1 Tax=Anopheles merus TaxID=30066 RepID=A0A182UR44_ANOME